MSLRVVLDTNIVVSGFLWRGLPNRILKATSLGTPEQLTATYESFVDIVVPRTLKETVVIADPSDDIVIATALAANAQFVITGNKHLLDLSHVFHFKIIAPALFIRELN
jgi:predicted nucleic acid-binding protein